MEVKPETQTTAQRPQRDQRPRDQRPGPSPANRTARPGGVQKCNQSSMGANEGFDAFFFLRKTWLADFAIYQNLIGSGKTAKGCLSILMNLMSA